MKKLLSVLSFVTILIGGLTAPAEAILLYQDSFLSANRPGIDPLIEVQAFYQNELSTNFFNGYTVDLSDANSIGSVFTAQVGDTGFSEFAALMTDGLDQNWLGRYVVSNGIQAIQRSDAVSFGTSLFSTNNIDLAGYSISQLQFTIDSIQPIAFQGGYRWNSTIAVFGDINDMPNAVPEPMSIILFGSGMVGAVMRQRTKS